MYIFEETISFYIALIIVPALLGFAAYEVSVFVNEVKSILKNRKPKKDMTVEEVISRMNDGVFDRG